MLTESEKQFTETNIMDYIISLQKELKRMFKELTQTKKRKDKKKVKRKPK